MEAKQLLPAAPHGLIAGSGLGHEAHYVQARLEATLVAADLAELPSSTKQIEFIRADVADLPCPDAHFDFAFCYHVLEHVQSPAETLDELRRVLKADGCLYIGTPNRHRLVGYLGSYDATLPQKLTWNLKEYRQRITGTFHNALGAHAGFSHAELAAMLEERFSSVVWLTKQYLCEKYSLGSNLTHLLARRGIRDRVAPAIYAICSNGYSLRSVELPSQTKSDDKGPTRL